MRLTIDNFRFEIESCDLKENKLR